MLGVVFWAIAAWAEGQDHLSPKTYLRVSVEDRRGALYSGFRIGNFQLLEDGVEQKIEILGSRMPVRLGVVIDLSASNEELASHFLDSPNPTLSLAAKTIELDFVVLVHTDVVLIRESTPLQTVDQAIKYFQSLYEKGKKRDLRTALIDGVAKAVQFLEERRKTSPETVLSSLLLISDGEDNASDLGRSRLNRMVKSSRVQIHALGQRGELGYGRGYLERLTRLTGGAVILIDEPSRLQAAVDYIRTDLANQYVLVYDSTRPASDGKWRKVEVRLTNLAKKPKLRVRTRPGYFP